MDCSTLKFVGYHGTCSKFKNSIECNGLDPTKAKHREDHWLGQGVYYFEEYEQALWWARSISTKSYNFGNYSLIYQSDIEAKNEEVLDLDNNGDLDRFFTYIINNIGCIEKDDNGKYPVFDSKKFRAVYFDYYKIKNNVSVIIYTFKKNCVRYGSIRNKPELDIQMRLTQDLGIFYSEKQICVSKKECIKNTVMVYNENEEVI